MAIATVLDLSIFSILALIFVDVHAQTIGNDTFTNQADIILDSISFNNIMKDDTLAILTREDVESGDKDAVCYVRGTKNL